MIKEQNLISGLAWHWEEYYSDKIASLFDCVLYLKYGAATHKTITPTKDGDYFVFDVTAAASTDYTADEYAYQYVFTEIETGYVTVIDGVVKIGKLLSLVSDSREYNQQVLEALRAALLEVAGAGTVAAVSMNGKSIQFRDPESLKNLIEYFEAKVGINRTQYNRILASF